MSKIREVASEFCRAHHCHRCPEYPASGGNCIIYTLGGTGEPVEDIISRLYHWLETRPKQPETRADLFFKTFPDARMISAVNPRTGKSYKIPEICAQSIFSDIKSCDRNCMGCWLTQITAK